MSVAEFKNAFMNKVKQKVEVSVIKAETKDLIQSKADKILVTRKVKREKEILDINTLSVSVTNQMAIKQFLEQNKNSKKMKNRSLKAEGIALKSPQGRNTLLPI